MRVPQKRFNCIDLLLLLLLAAALVFAIGSFVAREGVFTKYKYDVEYKIRIDSLDASFAQNISEGDTLRDVYTAFPIGTVKKVETDSGYSRDGSSVIRAVITVHANAEKHSGVLSINGVEISRGRKIEFRAPHLEYSGQCVDIKVEENNLGKGENHDENGKGA